MNNILTIAREDIKHLFCNVVSIVLTVCLVLMPSMFSWINTLACWDVFENTGSLKVAVACEDLGYKGDILPVTVNIGEEVISGLRANEDIGWVFTDVDDAVEGAKAGIYYAAVVVPADFTERLVKYCFGQGERATIFYYSNEKESAIAPKITDQGADGVVTKINTLLAEVLTTVALGTVDSLWDYAQAAGMDDAVLGLPGNVRDTAGKLDFMGDTLDLYSAVALNAAGVAASAAQVAVDLQAEMVSLDGAVSGLGSSSEETVRDLQTAISDVIAALEGAVGEAPEGSDLAAAQAAIRAAISAQKSQLEPALAQLRADLDAMVASMAASSADIQDAGASAAGRLSQLSSELEEMSGQMAETAAKLHDAAAGLEDFAQRLEEALLSSDVETVKTLLGTDVEVLASALTEPVGMERVAVFPSGNFGSAMSPLYSTLALFVGALLIMVSYRAQVEPKLREKLVNPRRHQEYLGHMAGVLLLSTMQSLILALGNLFFLQVRAVHPWLYLLTIWLVGAVFSFIIYTLVYLFANLGKATGVILLVMQVTGCAGSFPLALLPGFVSQLSPYLPATYAVQAIRAAMFGVWNGDIWVALGALLLFAAPLLLAGLLLGGVAAKLMGGYLKRVEKCKLMN